MPSMPRDGERLLPHTEPWLEAADPLRVGPTEISQHRDGISLTDMQVRIIGFHYGAGSQPRRPLARVIVGTLFGPT